MNLIVNEDIDAVDPIHCQIYVEAYTENGERRVVTLAQLTRESLLEYVREHGAEKVLLHTFGHY